MEKRKELKERGVPKDLLIETLLLNQNNKNQHNIMRFSERKEPSDSNSNSKESSSFIRNDGKQSQSNIPSDINSNNNNINSNFNKLGALSNNTNNVHPHGIMIKHQKSTSISKYENKSINNNIDNHDNINSDVVLGKRKSNFFIKSPMIKLAGFFNKFKKSPR